MIYIYMMIYMMIYACILMLIMFQVKPERHLPQVDSLATKPQHFQAGHRPGFIRAVKGPFPPNIPQ